jgi:CHASE2 domain-containing sensor protein
MSGQEQGERPPGDGRGRKILVRLRDKGLRYWVTASIVFLLAVTGSSQVYEYLGLQKARSSYFQALLDWGPRPPSPKFVKIVLVEDQNYWLGYPAGRRPIKRDYLAHIIDRLVCANANLIALDFDTRSPDPNTPAIPAEYQAETKVLIESIEKAARKGKKVVLATNISHNGRGGWRRDASIYDAFGYCKTASADKAPFKQEESYKENITCGYIELPDDPLVVPLRVALDDGGSLDSFALAVARALRPELIEQYLADVTSAPRYANYISVDKFVRAKSRLNVDYVLNATDRYNLLEANAFVIGGHWSSLADGRGAYVDSHLTPVGSIAGVELQANLIESLLDTRTLGTTPIWFLHSAEIAFSLLAAIVFAVLKTIWQKLAGVLAVFVLLLFIQWIVLHGFGIFFDAFVPLLGLSLHTLYERIFMPGEDEEPSDEEQHA